MCLRDIFSVIAAPRGSATSRPPNTISMEMPVARLTGKGRTD
jgi:hypothetical protein